MAGIVPVLVGTAASGMFVPWRFVGALVVALSLQVAVNLANDYFDGTKGVDTPLRIGPRRMTASGLIEPAQMRLAIALCLAVAAVSGGLLAIAAGPELLVVGAAAILAALAYSGGPRPYASMGLGEVAVFVFFGLVATTGSAYVQTEAVSWAALAASAPVGLLATSILVVNNLRDITTDRAAGKMTLAVRLGDLGARKLYRRLIYGAAASLALVHLATGSFWVLLPLVASGIAARALTKTADAGGASLVPLLGLTARLHLVFGAALAIGLAIAL